MATIIDFPSAETGTTRKGATQVNTHEVSLDKSKTDWGVTFALQWPKGMNTFLIVPNLSRIEGSLKKRGWNTKSENWSALMMAAVTMSLPKGTVTYPEKAAQDWAAVVGEINGTINLGLVPNTPVTISATTAGLADDGVTFGVQWPKGMNTFLIEPSISLIEGELKQRGWNTKVEKWNTLMMAAFSMSLPEGEFTYPERAAEDWAAAVGQVNGSVNLGLLAGDFTTQATSLGDAGKDAYAKFAIQYPEDINQNLILPILSLIQSELEQLHWVVDYQRLDALRMAIYSMDLPEGHFTHPEKAAEDWEKVVSQLHGWVNLGIANGTVNLDAPTAKKSTKEKWFQGTIHWSSEMNRNLIEPMASGVKYELQKKGYKCSYYHGDGNSRVTTYPFSYTPAEVEIPEKVQLDWNAAAAGAKGGRNMGFVYTPIHIQ